MKNNSERKDVALWGDFLIFLAFEHLGREVARRPAFVVNVIVLRGIDRQTVVDEYGLKCVSVPQSNVLKFNVTMNDVHFLQFRQKLHQTSHQNSYLVDFECYFLATQKFEKVASVKDFHYQKVMVFTFEDALKFYQTLVAEVPKDFDLFLETVKLV